MEIRNPSPNEDEELLNQEEDQFHDVKSIRIKPSSLQEHFVAFANTDGGELIIGIEDKKVIGERLVGFKKIEDANDIIQNLLEQIKVLRCSEWV